MAAYIAMLLGSPARAGIDRFDIIGDKRFNRFPRTRGDRPLHLTMDHSTHRVPPHARG